MTRRARFVGLFVVLNAIFSWPVRAANVAPVISGSPAPRVYEGSTYRFVPTARDANGDTLRFSISNKPAWAAFDPATGRLHGTPENAHYYSNIIIRVSDGSVTRSLPAFSINVRWNHRPRISGTPPTRTRVGGWYSFQPTASDRDRQKLRFRISGKPAWASFSILTGRLYGTPPRGSAGTYSNIRIRVSDGDKVAWLPAFSIKVNPAATTGNHAPTISGRALTYAQVGRVYSFKPTAADVDNDRLSFQIAGKPSWATFDSSRGLLSGTPRTTDIGVYRDIAIKVTDGKATASLAPFTITVTTTATRSVTLNWTPPTRNTDGSALTDLAGYRIYYGTVSGQYSKIVAVNSAGATSLTVSGLTAGTWYFAMKSVDVLGVTSNYSGEVRVSL